MMKFSLTCEHGHSFDSWFRSGSDFARLQDAGMVTCETCGSANVQKALMAPAIRDTSAPAQPKAAGRDEKLAQMLSKMRDHVETKGQDMGDAFVSEARAIHVGDAPDRLIYGNASADDARDLARDGIKVAPLPFVPARKRN